MADQEKANGLFEELKDLCHRGLSLISKLEQEFYREDPSEDRLTNTYETDESLEAKKNVNETKSLTFEEVRTILSELSKSGKTADVKALLKRHGCNKLSEINPEDYSDLVDEAEEL